MPQVGEIAFHVQGDIGGVGVSRLRFTRSDAAPITGADCNAAAAAARNLFNSAVNYTPGAITWVCSSQVNIYDSVTGLVVPPLLVTSLPGTITGGGSGTNPAGTGIRLNWKTSTVQGRRLMRGATYFVPASQNAYSGTGAVVSGAQTAINAGAATYLTAMTTASLYPVVWHRPPKGTHAGGLTGIVYGGIVSSVPAGLRSRRS